MITQLEALDRMIEIINSGWTTNYNAKTINSRIVNPNDPAATCWCINGALLKTFALNDYDINPGMTVETRTRIDAAEALKAELNFDLPEGCRSLGITSFNDYVAENKQQVILQIQKTKDRLIQANG